MSGQDDQNCGCDATQMDADCCKLEAVVTVDTKGQILLPKDLRRTQNINPGDKFAIVNVGKKASNCCLILMKTNSLNPMVKNFLGPMMKTVIMNGNELDMGDKI